MALVQVLLQIILLSLFDGQLLDSAAFQINKECQLLPNEVSKSIVQVSASFCYMVNQCL